MSAQKLKEAKLLCEEQIKTTHKSRFYHIHLDVMQAFLDAYRRLESYKTDNETGVIQNYAALLLAGKSDLCLMP